LDRNTFELPQVKNAFVSDQAVRPAVEARETIGEPFGDVIGIEDGVFGGLGQALSTHRGDVNPRDGKDAGAAPGSSGDCADWVFAAQVYDGMAGKEIHEMLGDPDWTHAGPTATVRDAKRLVQVQVADVRSHICGPAKANLGVEIRSIHVHL